MRKFNLKACERTKAQIKKKSEGRSLVRVVSMGRGLRQKGEIRKLVPICNNSGEKVLEISDSSAVLSRRHVSHFPSRLVCLSQKLWVASDNRSFDNFSESICALF